MKMVRVETHLAPLQAVVRVFTDDGAVGVGQTAPRGERITAEALHEFVAPVFLGENPWDVQELVRRCLNKHYKFTGTFLYRALCGVETAVWDLLGKLSGQPVYRLLGGKVRSGVPVYASSMSREVSPEEEAERMAALVEEHGFRCVKIKVGGRMGRDVDAAPGRTERIVPLMRETLGDGVDICADANGGFTPAKAIRVGRMLEEHGYHFFEEPCPFQEVENTAAVAAALDIPVAGGEQDNSLPHFKRMIDGRVVDVVQPDVGYVGGITRARKVAEMAELAGTPCTPHNSGRTMLQVFTLHLAAAMPACHQYQEWRATDDQPWADEIFEPRPEVVDGVVRAPDRSGWGVEVRTSYLKKSETRVSKA